jgi:hypothetical protein
MKHIFDSEFRYRPSFDTDVRKTFEKARRCAAAMKPAKMERLRPSSRSRCSSSSS